MNIHKEMDREELEEEREEEDEEEDLIVEKILTETDLTEEILKVRVMKNQRPKITWNFIFNFKNFVPHFLNFSFVCRSSATVCADN